MTKKNEHKTTFSKNLTKLLKERAISLRAAASLAQVPYTTLNEWTSGRSPTDFHAVARLAKALGVSFEYLCIGTEKSTPISEIPLDAIFNEKETKFEGIFKIKAIRLTRKEGE